MLSSTSQANKQPWHSGLFSGKLHQTREKYPTTSSTTAAVTNDTTNGRSRRGACIKEVGESAADGDHDEDSALHKGAKTPKAGNYSATMASIRHEVATHRADNLPTPSSPSDDEFLLGLNDVEDDDA